MMITMITMGMEAKVLYGCESGQCSLSSCHYWLPKECLKDRVGNPDITTCFDVLFHDIPSLLPDPHDDCIPFHALLFHLY